MDGMEGVRPKYGTEKRLLLENMELRERLKETEETLEAIRNGEVDAIVVSGSAGEKIFSISSAETPYRVILEEMNEGALVISETGVILYCNNRFSEMIGVQPEQLTGSDLISHIGESEKSKFETLLYAGKEGRSSGVFLFQPKVNSLKYLHFSFCPLSFGGIGDVCIMAADITELKKIETELIDARENLENQVADRTEKLTATLKELTSSNEQLIFQNQINQTLEQVIYISSHNLQEPLRTISNYIHVLTEDYSGSFDERAASYLESVNEAAKRMKMQVKALLDTSRLGRGSAKVQADLNVLVRNVISDLSSMIINSGADIEVSEMPLLNVFEIEIFMLFQNLISNAIKFSRKGVHPRIKIYSEESDAYWKFSVSDEGIGIAKTHFDRIFIMFQRLHPDSEYEGNGIGLANCKKIVDLHHGTIWVDSVLGKGSTFNFTIPKNTL